MQWASVILYLVATIFVVVSSVPELCVVQDWGEWQAAFCGRDDVNYTFHFIPPIYQNISFIDLRGQPLKLLPYHAFRNVSSQSNISGIVLRYCEISHVDADALLNLHNLTTIDLSHNAITQIDSKLFSNTKQIEKICLNHNKIAVLPSGIFQNLPLLAKVYLFDNRIRQVETYSFKNTPALRSIDLNNNQIEFMDILFKDKFDNLTHLLLYDNPWKCDCELVPFYELVKNGHFYYQRPACEEPPTLQGRRWSNISKDEFVCSSEAATTTQDSVMNVPQPASDENWITYSILVLAIAVVFGLRYTLLKTSKRLQVRLPYKTKRRKPRRTNTPNMDSGIEMSGVQSSAVSEDGDSTSNMADVDEEQTSTRRTNTPNIYSGTEMHMFHSSTVSEDGDSVSNISDDVDEEQTSIRHCEMREVSKVRLVKGRKLPAGLNV